MKIYHNQLAQTLQQHSKLVWLIFGDEPWQKIDSLNKIKLQAKNSGFSETLRFNVDDKFDWSSLTYEFQSMSLFASQRIIELEIPNGKVGVEGAKVLTSLSEQLIPDIMLVIHGGKIDVATSKKKWFSALEKQGAYLPLYDIERTHLPRWLQQQADHLQLNLSSDAINFLAEYFEGNLLALAQELEKLTIIYQHQHIKIDDLEQLIIKQAKFNPFQLIDNLLNNKLKKCSAILESLQHEGTSIGQIIWILHKELQQLSQMKTQLEQGDKIENLYKQYRIWDKRKPLYKAALSTMQNRNIDIALARLAQVDLISKTASEYNPFILLIDVCLSVYHGDITENFTLNYEYA